GGQVLMAHRMAAWVYAVPEGRGESGGTHAKLGWVCCPVARWSARAGDPCPERADRGQVGGRVRARDDDLATSLRLDRRAAFVHAGPPPCFFARRGRLVLHVAERIRSG